jgi:hypothetical protein
MEALLVLYAQRTSIPQAWDLHRVLNVPSPRLLDLMVLLPSWIARSNCVRIGSMYQTLTDFITFLIRWSTQSFGLLKIIANP